MHITRTTEPATEPVTLAQVKEQLRIVDYDDDDTQLTTMISVARRAIEDMTGRTLIDTVFTQSVREWRTCTEILRGNAHTINSLVYDDTAGTEQTVDPATYGIHPFADGCAALALYDEFTEPDLLDRPYVDRVRFEFVAGYGAAAGDVPHPLRQAVLYLVAHYYDNRSPVGVNVNLNKVPFTVESLAAPYKIYN